MLYVELSCLPAMAVKIAAMAVKVAAMAVRPPSQRQPPSTPIR